MSRVVMPLVMVITGVVTFLSALSPSYSQAVPGITIQEGPPPLPGQSKQEVILDCADHTTLSKVMKAQQFKMIATSPNPLRMVMINPAGHILVALIVDNQRA